MKDTIDLYTQYGYLEDVPVEYELDVETYPAEPYSWGGGRGTETEVEVVILSILGRDPHEVCNMFGLNLSAIEQELERRHDA